MTDPTPPRAPDAVPEAVLQAFGAWRRAMHAFSENDTDANLGDVRRAGREAHIAVATALREATAAKDDEIGRLKAEARAHALSLQAEIARLTAELAELRKRPTLTQMMETLHLAQHASPFCSSFAWQDAAHAIRQLYGEEQPHD